ncbi:MAG: hypothetical protein IT384_18425 [Deltaproteobacteria bacterium]|nr:hypothetical protein [Deltaproteobacteria bacterium]
MFALGSWDGTPVALVVDTASPGHYVLTDRSGYATINFGKTSLRLDANGAHSLSETAPGGRPVVGVLGTPYFLEGTVLVDFERGSIGRVRSFHPDSGWVSVPFQKQNNYIFVAARVDGRRVRLGFDTGAPDSLLIGERGRPGDVEALTNDAYGHPVRLFERPSRIDLGAGLSFSANVSRTPYFKSIEDSNRRMGIDAQGLLGLSAMTAAASQMVIDNPRGLIWFKSAAVAPTRF